MIEQPIQIGDCVLVRANRRPYVGRGYDLGERYLYLETPFKSSPRRAALRTICQLVEPMQPQTVKL
mgnify:FL=1